MTNETHTHLYVTMDGLGNDFIIFDAREQDLYLSDEEVQLLADRTNGIGCDQLIIIRKSHVADALMEIRNADGGEVSACGNASRCIAYLLTDGELEKTISLETKAGLLKATIVGENMVSVDMGEPKFSWQEIPLTFDMDTLMMTISAGPLSSPVAVSMGNPHAVFFVDDVDSIDLVKLGPKLENHPIFPEGANISICSVEGGTIIQRVWERGVGITQACGTGACAAVVAANRREMMGRQATVQLAGGVLDITWREDNHVMMTGAINFKDTGTVTL